MYVRSYKQLPQSTQAEQEAPQKQETEQSPSIAASEPQKRKSRFKARRKMPEFHAIPEANEKAKSENERTRSTGKCENHNTATYTQSEMLVLAIAVLLLLEGTDDILILALGYTLCP